MESDRPINKFIEHNRVDDSAYDPSGEATRQTRELNKKKGDMPRAEPEEMIPTARDLLLRK